MARTLLHKLLLLELGAEIVAGWVGQHADHWRVQRENTLLARLSRDLHLSIFEATTRVNQT